MTKSGNESGGRRPLRWLIAWSAFSAVAVAVAFVCGMTVRSPWQDALAASSAEPWVTASVETRTLTLSDEQVTGTVALGSTLDVVVQPTDGSDAVVTALSLDVGGVLQPGHALAEVSGRPVIALDLPFALYRDLEPGMSGTDVLAVQQALSRLGLYAGAQDGQYGAVTAAAVSRLYTSADVAVPVVDADRVTSLKAAQKARAQAATALTTARSEHEQALADVGAEDTTAARRAEAAADMAVEDATSALADAQSALDDATLAVATPLPKSEVIVVPAAGAIVVALAGVGAQVSTDAPVARLRSGSPRVVARVSAASIDRFPVGDGAMVTSVSGSAAAVDAVVAAVGEFVSAATADGSPPGYDVTLSLSDGSSLSDGESVTVVGDGASSSVAGLAVPLVAIRQDASGEYLDEALADESTRKVRVVVGQVADGYALVEGDGVTEGMVVLVDGSP